MEGMLCLMIACHIHLTITSIALITDLQKRLDRDTYCFRTQVFEAIGAKSVGPNYFVIYRRNVNHKLKVC